MPSQTGEDAPPDDPTGDVEEIDVLAEVRPVLAEGADFIAEEFRDGWCSPVYKRQITHNRAVGEGYSAWPPHVDRLFKKFVIASAGVIIQEPNAEDEPETLATELMGSRFEQVAADPELTFLTSRIAEAVVATRRAQELAERMTDGLHSTVTTEEDRYTLMTHFAKAVPYPGESDETQDDREIQTLQLLDTFMSLDGEDKSAGTSIFEGLKTGEFDGFIAEAVLEAVEDSRTMIDTPTRQEAEKMIGLAGLVLGEEGPGAIARLITPEARALWPETPAKLFQLGRSDFIESFARNRRDYQAFLTAFRCLPPEATVGEDLPNLAEDILLETAKIRSKDTDVPMPKRIRALSVVDTMEKRKRRRRPQQPTQIDASLDRAENPEADTEELESPAEIRRELAYIRPDGSKAPEGSDECNKIFEDYVASQGNRAGLEQDLESISEWLKTMDLSSGTPRGIKTLGGGQTLKRGSVEFSKIYQLKPSDAVGLSLSSGLGSKTRVVFVMENNTIGILGIGRRDNMRALLKKVGVRGRSHRK